MNARKWPRVTVKLLGRDTNGVKLDYLRLWTTHILIFLILNLTKTIRDRFQLPIFIPSLQNVD